MSFHIRNNDLSSQNEESELSQSDNLDMTGLHREIESLFSDPLERLPVVEPASLVQQPPACPEVAPSLDLSAFNTFSSNSAPREQLWWPTQAEFVYMFLDNSYTFIEGQKAAALRRDLRSRLDPRIRIHMANMRQELCGPHRIIKRSCLYGSEAQSLSSVWSSAKSAETEVQVFRRSPVTGKERNVEARIVSDLNQLRLEFASQLSVPAGERHTAVILTGDQAVVQPCRQLLLTTPLNIELHAYKHSHSRLFEVLASEFPTRVRICLLEPIFEKITFTNTLWDESKKQVPRERSLMLTLSVPSVFDHKASTEREVERLTRTVLQVTTAQRLTDILKLPVMTCFHGHGSSSTQIVASVVPSELSGEYSFRDLLRSCPSIGEQLTHMLQTELYDASVPESMRIQVHVAAYDDFLRLQQPVFVPSSQRTDTWQHKQQLQQQQNWPSPYPPQTPNSYSPPQYSPPQSRAPRYNAAPVQQQRPVFGSHGAHALASTFLPRFL
eukprot:m.559355 g.559355  ORF g.559355 m.559355 type:complete len:497 (+) comp57771_c0_seq1:334-1824(+)